MGVLPELGLVRSDDLNDVLGSVDAEHVPYAGGTELVPAMGLGLRRPAAVVDLKRVEALKGITTDAKAGTVEIGAAVTHRRIAEHPGARRHLPVLAEAAGRVGNARVRATGTIGGNLCFAEPRSDLACVLTALRATAQVRSAGRGGRTLAIDDLVVGAFETSLADDEILVSVIVPFQPAGMSYWKLQSYERPTLGVAVVAAEDRWEITVGAAVERPVRAVLAAGDSVGLDAFADGLNIVTDLCGPAEYKRSVLRERLRAVLEEPSPVTESRVLASSPVDGTGAEPRASAGGPGTDAAARLQPTDRQAPPEASNSVVIAFKLNGRRVETLAPVRLTAAELLRDRFGLTGTKVSCGIQVCGACTVLVDGEPASSCCLLAVDLDGTEVVTVEGLAQRRELHPVQEAFTAANALQCGYCTPGFVMMTVALLAANPEPDRGEVREWLDGNLCRCTGYAPIETAVMLAAERTAETERPDPDAGRTAS